MEYRSSYDSVLGEITLQATETHLTGLMFRGQKYYHVSEDAKETNTLPVISQTKRWLDLYFSGERPSTEELPPLLLRGTPFQKQVWAHLLSIPYGETCTYKDLAVLIARENGRASMSCQAIGQAVGHNPISILVPCHRVLGSDRSLTGYAGGVEKKAFLLKLERS